MNKVYYSDIKNCPTYALGFGDFARIEVPQNAKALAAFVGAELAKGRPMTDVRNSVAYFLQVNEELLGNYYTPEEIAEHDGIFDYMDFPADVKAMFDRHVLDSTLGIIKESLDVKAVGDEATMALSAACAHEVFDSLVTIENRRAEFWSSRFGVATQKPQYWNDISPEEKAVFTASVAKWTSLLRTDPEVLEPGCKAYQDREVAEGVVDRLSRSLHYAYIIDQYPDLVKDNNVAMEYPEGFVSYDDLSADMKADYEMVASIIVHTAVRLDLEIGHVVTEDQALEQRRKQEFEEIISTEEGCRILAGYALEQFEAFAYDDENWEHVIENISSIRNDGWVGQDLFVDALTEVRRDKDGMYLEAVSVEDGEPVCLTACDNKADIIELFSRDLRERGDDLYFFEGVSSGAMLWDMNDSDVVKVFTAALGNMRREYMNSGKFLSNEVTIKHIFSEEQCSRALDHFSGAMERLRNSDLVADTIAVKRFDKRSNGLSV